MWYLQVSTLKWPKYVKESKKVVKNRPKWIGKIILDIFEGQYLGENKTFLTFLNDHYLSFNCICIVLKGQEWELIFSWVLDELKMRYQIGKIISNFNNFSNIFRDLALNHLEIIFSKFVFIHFFAFDLLFKMSPITARLDNEK